MTTEQYPEAVRLIMRFVCVRGCSGRLASGVLWQSWHSGKWSAVVKMPQSRRFSTKCRPISHCFWVSELVRLSTWILAMASLRCADSLKNKKKKKEMLGYSCTSTCPCVGVCSSMDHSACVLHVACPRFEKSGRTTASPPSEGRRSHRLHTSM